MSSDEVDGDLSQHGKIADGGAVANPAVILSEGNVEHPMQAVSMAQCWRMALASISARQCNWIGNSEFRPLPCPSP
jgi:hypothetical protein